MRNQKHRLIGYMSGPVDGAEVYRRWKDDRALDYFGTSYLAQFFEVVRGLDAKGVVITYQDSPDQEFREDAFEIYNFHRREPRGIAYHIELIRRVLRSARLFRRKGVHTVIMTEAQDYWFAAAIMRFAGIRMIPALHCTLWPMEAEQKASHRVLRWLNQSLFYRPLVGPTLAASGAIARQLARATGRSSPASHVFMPSYRRGAFDSVPPPDRTLDQPFVILSAGRIEEDKGVFDLVEAVERLVAAGHAIECHFCGEGTALPELERQIAERGLADRISVHGFCGRDKLLEMFGLCHVVVVPTRSSFQEGFAMICAEGILAGRPVVTSRICPGLEYIRAAAVEVPPDDVGGYADAFERLATDPAFYAEKVAAAAGCQAQFYDPANSYGAKLAEALAAIDRRSSPTAG